jgi:hypothetical protein
MEFAFDARQLRTILREIVIVIAVMSRIGAAQCLHGCYQPVIIER